MVSNKLNEIIAKVVFISFVIMSVWNFVAPLFIGLDISSIELPWVDIFIITIGFVTLWTNFLNSTPRLITSIVLFVLLPIYLVTHVVSSLYFEYSFGAPFSLWHLYGLLEIAIILLLFSCYLYVKIPYKNIRPVWQFISFDFLKNSVLGKEPLYLSFWWLGALLISVYYFGVVKVLRSFRFDIGLYYTGIALALIVAFSLFWSWVVIRCKNNTKRKQWTNLIVIIIPIYNLVVIGIVIFLFRLNFMSTLPLVQ